MERDEEAVAFAVRICGDCPVLALCRDYALATAERDGAELDGVWGGLTPEERLALRRRKRLERPRST